MSDSDDGSYHTCRTSSDSLDSLSEETFAKAHAGEDIISEERSDVPIDELPESNEVENLMLIEEFDRIQKDPVVNFRITSVSCNDLDAVKDVMMEEIRAESPASDIVAHVSGPPDATHPFFAEKLIVTGVPSKLQSTEGSHSPVSLCEQPAKQATLNAAVTPTPSSAAKPQPPGVTRMRAWLRDHGVDQSADPHFLTDAYIQESMAALKDGR